MAATILQTIAARRMQDVADAKLLTSVADLKSLQNKYGVVSLAGSLRRSMDNGLVAVMAEVKRASPSKGLIAPDIDATAFGLTYAKAGAAAISCLTEPTWFKGTLEDMREIREAIHSLSLRPALLRKDFIVDEYQIYEARAYGADALLLIVAILSDEQLSQLLATTQLLGMEALVEVNTAEEMKRALSVGATVIGINNRNLHDFTVDMNTTGHIVSNTSLPSSVIVCALSGITQRSDVVAYTQMGVRAVLVGEALMRAKDPAQMIAELRGEREDRHLPSTSVSSSCSSSSSSHHSSIMVKICGIKDIQTAIAACEAGASFIEKSSRKVSVEEAKAIVAAVKKWRASVTRPSLPSSSSPSPPSSSSSFASSDSCIGSSSSSKTPAPLQQLASCISHNGVPLVVAVFADQEPAFVREIVQCTEVDCVQLSGYESADTVRECLQLVSLPVFKAVHLPAACADLSLKDSMAKASEMVSVLRSLSGCIPLLDTLDPSARGGTGKTCNWDIASSLSKDHGISLFLAGGLNVENVSSAIERVKPVGVDVSSGVETQGVKDIEKIKAFVANAKA